MRLTVYMMGRCTHVLLVTSSTVTRSHSVVSIKAWRLSRQICHTAESCHFCRELAYRGWQLRPGHRLGSPQRVSNTSPADTWSVNKTFFCETASSHQMRLQYFCRSLPDVFGVFFYLEDQIWKWPKGLNKLSRPLYTYDSNTNILRHLVSINPR